MTVYVKEKCRRCGQSLTGGYIPDYFTVGTPIAKCSKCGSINSRAKKQNEWVLIGPIRKMRLLLLAAYWGFAVAITLGGLVIPGIIAVTTGSEMGTTLVDGFAWIVPLSLFLGGAFSFGGLFRQVSASKRRMKDAQYVEELRKLGFDTKRTRL